MAVDTSAHPAPPASDPTQSRYLTSYIARRAYSDEVQYPPQVPGVRDAIDIHCHAHDGQQDALALAKHASANGMKGILYKSIVGRARPAESVRKLQAEFLPWCDANKVTPVQTWAGFNIGSGDSLATPETVRQQLEDGVIAIWMPTARHANTINKIGGRTIWWDKSAPNRDSEPLPWDRAVQVGHYLLGDNGRLKSGIEDIFRIVADKNAAIFFAHATHPEIEAMAELTGKLGIKKAVVDHPFSPFVNLSLDQMLSLTRAGIYVNFTYDELSPLLGVDPQRMYDTIRALGVHHVTLSSDAGEPLFPNTVECIRLIRGLMQAFGLNAEEIRQVSTVNPGKIVGVEPA